MRRVALLGLLVSLTLSTTLLASEWKKQFTDDTHDVRSQAYDALRAASGDERESAIEDLVKVYQSDLKRYQSDVRKLKSMLPGYADGQHGKLFERWLQLREKAFGLYMDEQLFPFPRGGAVKGPQEGYDKVMPHVNAATGEYQKRIRKAILGAAKKWMHPKLAAKIEDIDAAAALLQERCSVLTEIGAEHDTFEVVEFNLVRATALLGADQYDAAVSMYKSDLDSDEKNAFFFFHSEAINMWNRKNPNGHSRTQLKVLDTVNQHRIGLGASPLQANEMLHRALTKHEGYCNSTGFAGNPHIGKGDSQTAQMRCAKEGYRGEVNENLTTASSSFGANTGWKYDGAHYRCMVNPKYTQVGVGNHGLQPGVGMPTAVPLISPPWHSSLFERRQPARR